jgi:hypothetical protein
VIAVAVVVAVAAAVLLTWSRLAHDVTSNPGPDESTIAKTAWLTALGVVSLIPLLLSVRIRTTDVQPRWPILETLILGSVTLYCFGVLVWRWPAWREVVNQDFEVLTAGFVVAVGVFASALLTAVSGMRKREGLKAAANLTVCGLAWTVAFMTSWVIVYFE